MVLRDLVPVEDDDVSIALPDEMVVEGCLEIVGNRASRASAHSVYANQEVVSHHARELAGANAQVCHQDGSIEIRRDEGLPFAVLWRDYAKSSTGPAAILVPALLAL